MKTFTTIFDWSKKKSGKSFLSRESDFMSTIDQLFDVFCINNEQRRHLEKQHGLRMSDDDYSFYNDQKGQRQCSLSSAKFEKLLGNFAVSFTNFGKNYDKC